MLLLWGQRLRRELERLVQVHRLQQHKLNNRRMVLRLVLYVCPKVWIIYGQVQ
jgi:lipid A disaccharide synthetase